MIKHHHHHSSIFVIFIACHLIFSDNNVQYSPFAFLAFFHLRSRLLVSFADFRRCLDLAVDYSNMLVRYWLLSLSLRVPPHFLQRTKLPCSLVDPPAGSPAGSPVDSPTDSQRHSLTPPSVEGYLVSSISEAPATVAASMVLIPSACSVLPG